MQTAQRHSHSGLRAGMQILTRQESGPKYRPSVLVEVSPIYIMEMRQQLQLVMATTHLFYLMTTGHLHSGQKQEVLPYQTVSSVLQADRLSNRRAVIHPGMLLD